MKRMFCGLCAVLLCCSLVFANGTQEKEEPSGPVTLTFMVNTNGDIQVRQLQQLSDEWAKETGNVVEFSAPGSSYEELLKTKMAANELPDLFTTHGWSVLRYSEYLMPVNELPWFSDISSQILPAITDKEGQVFVLPMDIDLAGIVYNAEVLEQAKVDVDAIHIWQDFEDACEKVKAIGKVPIHMGGKDNWTIGSFFDYAAPAYFITDDNDNQRAELKAGTFDEERWGEVAQLLADMVAKGYFNADSLTSDYDSDLKALAAGETAFNFNGNYAILAARQYNADADLGMMPLPSRSDDDQPTLICGEETAIGVWKDSPHRKAAVEFLNFLARPENIAKVATVSGCPAGLTTATSELGDLKQYYDAYASLRAFPYFDREYLPSGMWDLLCSSGEDILAGKTDAVRNSSEAMARNFSDRF